MLFTCYTDIQIERYKKQFKLSDLNIEMAVAKGPYLNRIRQFNGRFFMHSNSACKCNSTGLNRLRDKMKQKKKSRTYKGNVFFKSYIPLTNIIVEPI